MKPLKLTIKGLNSFVQPQIIDFEELSSKGIFGIFGPTGSGKSTILDGITLALYGDLARHSNGFVNSGEEVRQANISLTFQISGANPRIFQVDRTYTKNKDASKKPVSKAVLKEITDSGVTVLEEGTGAVNEACQQLVGLKKEDFLRTVVLPQGKFSEFLMLTGKERNEMLERLFNLEQYGEQLSGKIGEEKRILSHAMENLKGRLSGYEDVSTEGLDQMENQYQSWKTEYEKLEKSAVQVQAGFEEKEKLRHLLEEKAGYQRLLENLSNQEDQVRQWENQADLAEEILSIRPVYQAWSFKSKERIQAQEKVRRLEQETFAANRKLDAAVLELEQAKKEEEAIPELLEWKRNLELALPKNQERMELERENEKRKEVLNSLLEELAELEQTEKGLEGKKKQAAAAQQEISEKLNQNQVSSELRQRVQKGLLLETDLEKTKAEWAAAAARKEKRTQRVQALEGELQKVKNQEAEALEELSSCRNEDLRQTVRNLRKALKEGQPCPVCGSVHHGSSAFSGTESEEQNEELHLTAQMEILEERSQHLQEKVSKIQLNLSSEKAKLETEEEQVQTLLDKAESLEMELKQLVQQMAEQGNHGQPDWDFTQTFQMQQNRIYQMDKTTEDLRNRRNRAEEAVKKLEESWEAVSRKKVENELKQAKAETEKAQAEGRLYQLKTEISSLIGEVEAASLELTRTVKQIERIQAAVKNLQQVFEEKRQAAGAMQEALKVGQAEQVFAQSGEKEAQEQLSEAILNCRRLHVQMETASVSVDAAIKTWGLTKEEIEKRKEAVSRYCEEAARITSLIAEKDVQIQGRHLSEEEWKQAVAEKKQIEIVMEEKRTEGVRLSDGLETGRKRLKEKNEILKEYQKKEHRQALVLQLEKLIKGKRFVEYAAREKLHYVSGEASVLLRQLSCGNYELECNEQGHFQIVDFKNGGVRRFVNTLSGGEVFLASLSLALALSSQIQLNSHASLELFFLDEGFGTLDDNLLDIVMDALENLRSLSSRAIGLITHVEKIQNQIPVKLLVKPAESGGKGSQVEIVYS